VDAEFFVCFSESGGNVIGVLIFSLATWETDFTSVGVESGGALGEEDVDGTGVGVFEERDEDGCWFGGDWFGRWMLRR